MTNNQNQNGLTLIELLVVSIILILLAMATLGLQTILGETQKLSIDNYTNVSQIDSSLNNIIKELRTAKTSESGTYAIESANNNEIIFYSDINFDNSVDRVRYTLIGTTLTKGVIKPTGYPAVYLQSNEKVKILSTNIRNGSEPLFYYYNDDWPIDTANNPLTSPPVLSEIKLVRINIRINEEENEPNKDFILDGYASLRMLKDNL